MANEEAIRKIQALRKIREMRSSAPVTESAPPNPFKQKLVDKLGHDPFAQLGDAPPPNPVAGGQVPPPREQAKLGGMVLGEVVGGPVGAAGGYALTDQLLKRFLDNQEITPGGAATSLGVGGIYAAAGPVINKVGSGLKSTGLTAYRKGVRPTKKFTGSPASGTGAKGAKVDEALEFGAANGVIATEGSLTKNLDEVGKLSESVEGLIQKAKAEGADTIPIGEAFESLSRSLKRASVGDKYGRTKKRIAKYMQEQIDDHGYNIPIDKAQEMKREIQRQLSADYDKISTLEKEYRKDFAHGLREGIEARAPGVKAPNEEMGKRILLNNMIADRTSTTDNQAVLGLADLVAAKAFGAYGFLARKGASSPAVMTGLGSQLYRRGANLESLGRHTKPGSLYGLQLLVEKELNKREGQ